MRTLTPAPSAQQSTTGRATHGMGQTQKVGISVHKSTCILFKCTKQLATSTRSMTFINIVLLLHKAHGVLHQFHPSSCSHSQLVVALALDVSFSTASPSWEQQFRSFIRKWPVRGREHQQVPSPSESPTKVLASKPSRRNFWSRDWSHIIQCVACVILVCQTWGIIFQSFCQLLLL